MQALEGKDVKDLLLNVGSGGGAAPAAGGAGGGAAAGGDAPAEAKEEKKEEGMLISILSFVVMLTLSCREGGIRRGYGFWSFRLDIKLSFPIRRFFVVFSQMSYNSQILLQLSCDFCSWSDNCRVYFHHHLKIRTNLVAESQR